MHYVRLHKATQGSPGCYLGGECRLAVPLKCHRACQWSWRIRVRHTPSRANRCPVTSIRRPTGSVNYQRQWRLWRVRVMKCQTRYQCQCHCPRPHSPPSSLAGWPGGGTGKPGLLHAAPRARASSLGPSTGTALPQAQIRPPGWPSSSYLNYSRRSYRGDTDLAIERPAYASLTAQVPLSTRPLRWRVNFVHTAAR